MIVQRVKELASGAFAHAVMKKKCLLEIRAVIKDFVGQEEGNLKRNNYYTQYPQQYQEESNFKRNFNQYRQ